jgi:hypothetical protein
MTMRIIFIIIFIIFSRIRINNEKPLLASSCLSVRLSLRLYQQSSHWTDILEILYWRPLWKSVEKLEFQVKKQYLPVDIKT